LLELEVLGSIPFSNMGFLISIRDGSLIKRRMSTMKLFSVEGEWPLGAFLLEDFFEKDKLRQKLFGVELFGP